MNVPVIAFILAGGASSRLGRDKSAVRLGSDDEPDLLANTAALLSRCVDDVRVIGPAREGHTCIKDDVPGCGPVGGIATALRAAQGKAGLILSCDLPFMNEATLLTLLEGRAKRPPNSCMTAFIQKETGYVEPLVAVYEPEAFPYFDRCVELRLLKIRLVVPKERQHYIPYSTKDVLPFFNINGPADLESARRMLALSKNETP